MPIELLDPTGDFVKTVIETSKKAKDPLTKAAVLNAGVYGYALKEEDLPVIDKVIDDTLIESLGYAH